MLTPSDRATGSGSPTAMGSRLVRARSLRSAPAMRMEMRSAPGRQTGRRQRRSRSTECRHLPARWRRGSRSPALRGDRRVSGWGDGNGRAMGSSLRDPRNAGPGNAPTSRGEAGNPVETGRARGVSHLFRATPGDRAASGSVRLHVFPRALRECDPATGRHRSSRAGTGRGRRPRGAGTRHRQVHDREARHARCDRSDRPSWGDAVRDRACPPDGRHVRGRSVAVLSIWRWRRPAGRSSWARTDALPCARRSME